MSGVVSQKNVVNQMVELADAGVAYNLELRAFLAATSENIAATFDAFDSNLARLIRIQQTDTTAARLGMESLLTELFNEYFSDSSYMTQGGTADTVTGNIMGAMSQMDKNSSLQFEFMLQKWLGSLYSLGLSDEAVSTISQGINYLGTGDITNLNSNTTLQTLMAMSAARAGGKSYAEMLTHGLTAEDTNNLLKAMIEYLAEIAESQENMVTKSAYAELFGMSITDLSTFSQIKQSEIDNLYKVSHNYESMMLQTSSQMLSMVGRLNISTIIDTAIENATTSAAVGIGTNPALYGLWKILNIVEGLTGGIPLPSISYTGTGFSLEGLTIEQVAKGGVAGIGLLGSLAASLFGGSLLGTFSMDKWGYDEYTSRGSNMSFLTKGVESGLSQSGEMNMVGSASSEDVKKSSTADANEGAKEDTQTSDEKLEESQKVTEQIRDAVWSDNTNVLAQLQSLVGLVEDVVTGDKVFYTAIKGIATNASATSTLLMTEEQLTAAKNKLTTSVSAAVTDTTLEEDVLPDGSMIVGGKVVKPVETQDFSTTLCVALKQALSEWSPTTTFNTNVTNVTDFTVSR